MKPTAAEAINLYRNLRTEKEAIKARHVEELRPIAEAMAKIEAWLLRELNAAGAQHIATPVGTAMRVVKKNVTIDDWDTALDHLRKHELWHMLEHRLSKTAVEEYTESQEENFPGTHISTEITVQIRKA